MHSTAMVLALAYGPSNLRLQYLMKTALKILEIDPEELLLRENSHVEWKENVADIDSVLKTITAFSNDLQNAGGGYVVCGAKETRDTNGFQRVQLVGLDASRFKEIEGKVMSDCRTRIYPSVAPLVKEVPAEDPKKKVLIFVVPATRTAHALRITRQDSGIHYIRIGKETREARNGLLRELLVKKNALPPWDRRLNENAKLVDMDIPYLRATLAEMGLDKEFIELEGDFLKPLSALVPSLGDKRNFDTEIHPRNFTIALFGREPTRFFPGAWTNVSFYPGKDRSETASKTYTITGGLIEQTRKTLSLLEIQQPILIDKNSPIPNLPEYPERALREAIVNAIVHRDYESDQPTRITVFADRVEICSPGALPRAIDRERFLEGKTHPVWRNQSLAWFFNRLQLSQAEGQGIPTIFRTMQESGSPSPQFKLNEEATSCILYAHPRHEENRYPDTKIRALNSRAIYLLNEKTDKIHETPLLPKNNRENVMDTLFPVAELIENTPVFLDSPLTQGVLKTIAGIKTGEIELNPIIKEKLCHTLSEIARLATKKTFNL
jgi:ATP-dependent DNA helicase RecG